MTSTKSGSCVRAGWLLGVAFALGVGGAFGQDAPRLQIDREIIDVGEVLRGTESRATYVFRNTGTATLRILKAEPG